MPTRIAHTPRCLLRTLLLAPLLAPLLAACADEHGTLTAPPTRPLAIAQVADGEVAIYTIQGAGHVSPFDGDTVTTTGIVTALAFNGFYVQDQEGDGNNATSDGVFTFTGGAPAVAAGDEVRLTGPVSEFIPGGAASGNLSTTQISRPSVVVLSNRNPLPEPVLLGAGGRIPPAVNVISPGETPVNLQITAEADANPFNPDTDGIDFFESLEAMRVTVKDPVAVSPTRTFSRFSSELFTLTDNGANVAPTDARTARGGISLQPDPDNRGDQNPERVQLQFDGTLFPAAVPAVAVGDRLRDATGVVGYSFGNFEVNVTESFAVSPAGLERESTALAGTSGAVTVATYNVLNLNARPEDDTQRAGLAAQIANNLRAPDVVALQEIQDDNGEQGGPANLEADATGTLQALADAVVAAGGPRYAFVDVAPAPNSSGGVPGGNIRNAFLYNPDRVRLASVVSLTPAVLANTGAADPLAFQNSRNPLAATFEFGGGRFTVINNHFSSRSGSTPIFGAVQPFVQAAEDVREAQAGALHDYVASVLAADRNARVVVVGDLNTFEFTDDLTRILAGDDGILASLLGRVGDDNRYTFNFDGNSQVLDHVFATRNLLDGAELDIVHVNVDFPRLLGDVAASDHEPQVARLRVQGDDGRRSVVDRVLAFPRAAIRGFTGLDGELLRFRLRDMRPDGPWTLRLDWGDGVVHTPRVARLGDLSFLRRERYAAPGTYTVTVTATDAGGLTSLPATATLVVP